MGVTAERSRLSITVAALAALVGAVHFSPESAVDDNDEHEERGEVHFHNDAWELDFEHRWVAGWFGVYRRTDSSHGGRPTFEKWAEPQKILWFAADRGYWHLGHLHDMEFGAAMIASHDREAMSPNSVDTASHPWRVVPKWVGLPHLHCVRAPPRTLYLSGHASSRWVADWLGPYERQDEASTMVNGWPSYRREHCRQHPCTQRLWLAAGEGERVWALGDAPAGGSDFVLAVRGEMPHSHGAIWTMADDSGGWQPAPSLRCTAVRAESHGWYVSWAEEALDSFVNSSSPGAPFYVWSTAVRSLLLAVPAGADAWSAGVAAARAQAADVVLPTFYLRGVAVGTLAHVAGARASATMEHVAAVFGSMHPLEAAVATSLLWAIGVLVMLLVHRWWGERQLWLLGEDDMAEGDVEHEADSTPESTEEKRLAFACLSGAIEEVKDHVSEQQYLELYAAARWCFNLTPFWATSVPRPPSPRLDGEAVAEGADGDGRARRPGAAAHLALGVHSPICQLNLGVVVRRDGVAAEVSAAIEVRRTCRVRAILHVE